MATEAAEIAAAERPFHPPDGQKIEGFPPPGQRLGQKVQFRENQ